MGKYRNESLKISVNAVLTKSFINGRTNGKPGLHMLFIIKSAAFSRIIISNMQLNGYYSKTRFLI